MTAKIVAQYHDGASVYQISRWNKRTRDDVLGALIAAGVNVEDPRKPPRVCRLGHVVEGDNARRNGTYEDGRQRYECTRCGSARSRRRCVVCNEPCDTIRCEPCTAAGAT
jgi:hypothetical protein